MSERRRILIVDDDPGVCRALVRMLEPLYEVHTCVDPFDALAQVSVAGFDAILLDLCLPGMSGIELYERAIFARPVLATRFLFMSGNGDDKAMDFLDRADISSVRKPFDKAELHAKLGLLFQTWG